MIISDVSYTSPVPNSNRVMMSLALNCANQEEASDIYRILQRMSGNDRSESRLEIINRNIGVSTTSTARSIRSVVNLSEIRSDDGVEVVDMMGNQQEPTQFIELPQRPVDRNMPVISQTNQEIKSKTEQIEQAEQAEQAIQKPYNPIEDFEIID